MKIVWRKRARADLTAMATYVARDSPSGAARLYEQIEHSVGFLLEWPDLGRQSRKQGVRELVVPHTPYIVLYRGTAAAIYILRVIHSARKR